MNEIVGTSAIIVGYGQEGQSIYRYLRSHYPHLKLAIADKQKVTAVIDDSTPIYSGPDYLTHLDTYETIIRSPGIPARLSIFTKLKKLGRHVTTATNIFFSKCSSTSIGITGTKGKSTTASLAYEILRSHYKDVRLVGNIGKPMLDHLQGANKDTLFVVELSSHQLEDIRYSPHIAVLLAIVPEHLDHYGDFVKYIAAKKNITKYQTQTDYLIYHIQNEAVHKIAQASLAHTYPYALNWEKNAHCWIDASTIFCKDAKGIREICTTTIIPLLGKGNLENSLAAISVGILLRVPDKDIAQAIQKFKPLSNRLELVGNFRGITFYNDSLATIPEATIHALNALGKNVATLIVGGFDRGVDYASLGVFLRYASHIKTLILFPDTGKKIWQEMQNSNLSPKHTIEKYEVSDMKKAVEIAYQKTPEGKICLLSPASASFNLFKDYKERGDLFTSYVKEMAHQIKTI